MTFFSKNRPIPTPSLTARAAIRASIGLFSALLIGGCASHAPADHDELVLQICLRDPARAGIKQLDITAVHASGRDTGAAMAIGTSVKQQAIFETEPGPFDTGTTVALSLDRITWYVFTPPYDARSEQWSDWQPANFTTPSEDPAYKLQHGMLIERNHAGIDAVALRYRVMPYRELLAMRSARHFQIPRTDYVPC